ncbi:MAG: GTP-binding protein [Bacteroidales bacterium]|nr:GTP-binding protein [Bacteroidales bacterium]
MKKIPVYLVTGFLGSGKTTFIQRVIDTLSDQFKIAIIQNEFAPSNFDGKELRRTTGKEFDLLEINNGSVFCVCLLSGFIVSFKKFVEDFRPDVIFIEASGLSDPVSIGQIFDSPDLQNLVFLAGSFCIIDAKNYLSMNTLMTRINHQVMVADYIIINKTDLNDNYNPVLSRLNEINPFAEKFPVSFCNVSLDNILDKQTEEFQAGYKKMFVVSGTSGKPDINSAVLRTVKPLQKDKLESFITGIVPLCYRLKGYILLDDGKALALQATFGDYRTEIIEFPVKQTEIIAMGYNINVRTLKNLYQNFVS